MKLAFVVLGTVLTAASLHSQDKAAKPQAPAAAEKKAFTNVNPDAFDKLRRTGTNVVVLDVRTPEEYKNGHIPGAVLMDFNSGNFDKEFAKLDKNKTYLVHCGSGGRSARACKKMGEANFAKLFNLEGGMGAWEKSGKPVEK